MTKPLKYRIGVWLFFSVVAAAFLILIDMAIIINNGDGSLTYGGVAMLYFIFAFPVGVVLLIWGNIEFSRAYKAARQYAERHGWRPISRTSWRNRKANNVSLAVDQAFKKQTYLLKIEGDSETITIDEFESSLWALQFGDWLWSELLITSANPTTEDIEEKRAEWKRQP